jgi:hypothetical protein
MKRLLPILLLAPALALAQGPAEAAPEPFPRLGFSAAAGIPDGAVLNAVYRPLDFLRLSAGGSWNYFGFGLQGGAGVAPFHWPIDPTFNLEVGHYFDSDMTWVADQRAGVPTELRPLLERVGYNYVNAQVGLEIGSSRRFVFFVRAGLSYFWTTIHGVSQVTNTYATTSGTQTATVRIADPELRATLPSVKVGFLFYL